MANLLTTLTHPAASNSVAGPAPKNVIGQATGTVYTVSANAISSVDTRDLLPLLAEGWT